MRSTKQMNANWGSLVYLHNRINSQTGNSTFSAYRLQSKRASDQIFLQIIAKERKQNHSPFLFVQSGSIGCCFTFKIQIMNAI